VAFNTVDLVARVEGFLTSINYTDGAYVKKDGLLFLIEQTMYQGQGQGGPGPARLAPRPSWCRRRPNSPGQETLLRQNVTAQKHL